ncbi:MAG: DUF2330 domain-containing protein, partial [Gammaproteobacteria bacterium]|nr:DUF2330 domain-containing protein [Gammaproteobacteria bacterium]
TIEAKYTVGEYDILILSAEQSEGLITWLSENGYRIPAGANDVVRSYLARDMKFFVARVNLQQQSALGYTYLRPIQIAFESPRFMLPIRLGMVNAAGPQELFIYALTRTGRVETTNYRTVKLPSGNEIPAYVKSQFARFYKAMFERQTESESGRAVFLEYAWDMNWCDPCAADPLSPDELRELGVYWLSPEPAEQPIRPLRRGPRQARDVYVTRLHVRYDKAHFPEDLMFQQTGNRQNFQGRYVIRHPYKGPASCEQAREYFERTLPERLAREAATLANLTGWSMESIRPNLDLPVKPPAGEEQPWWKELWK